MRYIRKSLTNQIKSAFKENPETMSDLNLLCAYIWKYEGANEETSFEEFIVGLLEKRFTPQIVIAKVSKTLKKTNKNEQLLSL